MSHAGFPFSLLLLEEGQIIRSPVALQSQGSGVCVCVCVSLSLAVLGGGSTGILVSEHHQKGYKYLVLELIFSSDRIKKK